MMIVSPVSGCFVLTAQPFEISYAAMHTTDKSDSELRDNKRADWLSLVSRSRSRLAYWSKTSNTQSALD